MTTFYEDMAATARELIAEFGMPMTLVRPGTTQDPVAGTLSGTGSNLPTTGLFLSRTTATVREALAEGAERMALLDDTEAPDMNDRLTAGSDSLAIVRIDAINPAGIPLAYVVHLRR
jgi:hypothetical protein